MGDRGPTREHIGNALCRHIVSKSPNPMVFFTSEARQDGHLVEARGEERIAEAGEAGRRRRRRNWERKSVVSRSAVVIAQARVFD